MNALVWSSDIGEVPKACTYVIAYFAYGSRVCGNAHVTTAVCDDYGTVQAVCDEHTQYLPSDYQQFKLQ